MYKRLIITLAVGLIVTVFVYWGLVDSLNRPSISSIPIDPQSSIQILSRNLNESQSNFAILNYVYLRSNGTIYQSNIEDSSVGKKIGDTEPTTTSASHFAWEVLDKVKHKIYFLDHLTAEVISINNTKVF